MPLGLVLAVVLSGCGVVSAPQSMFAARGPVAAGQLQLIDSSMLLMLEIFVAVMAALAYILYRFRWRGETRLPPQVEGHTAIEIVWTIVPAIILALLAVGTVRESFALASPATGKNALQVDVTGHQFWWAFNYPSDNVTTANELYIPVGEKIQLNLTSADVMHAFWVPRLGGKTALVPGRTNIMWIEAQEPGIYRGQCAEFCGTGHADMRILVDAETPAKFDEWLQAMQHPVVHATTALAQAGEKDFQTDSCSACHTIGGTPYRGVVGPNLTNLAMRPMIAGNILPNNARDLTAWIHDPQAVKPGALMPDLHLPSSQIKALVAFLRTLKTPLSTLPG